MRAPGYMKRPACDEQGKRADKQAWEMSQMSVGLAILLMLAVIVVPCGVALLLGPPRGR